jgi:Fe2+ or Zn2+ uptake regulation protein
MKDAIDEIISALQDRGFRITKARKMLIKHLAQKDQPLSIQALCALLKDVDEASVYRSVRMLHEEGFLEEIAIAHEAPRYALSHGHHHHHAVCTSCGVMEHIACSGEKLPTLKAFQTIKSHEVTFYGLCKKCA